MKDEGIALKIKLQTKEKSFINKSCLKVTKVQSGIGGKKIVFADRTDGFAQVWISSRGAGVEEN